MGGLVHRTSFRAAIAVCIVALSAPVFAQVPNHAGIVQQVYAQGGHTITTQDGAGRFVEAVALALHRIDASFGHLKKPADRTHCGVPFHACDVVLYRDSGQIIDFIRDAGEPGASIFCGGTNVCWGVGAVNEYGPGDWFAPTGAPFPMPDPQPDPVDLGPIRAALAKLENDIKALTDLSAWLEARLATNERVDGEQATAINTLGVKVSALEQVVGAMTPSDPPEAPKNFVSWLFTTKEGIAVLGGIGALVGGLIVKLQPQPATP